MTDLSDTSSLRSPGGAALDADARLADSLVPPGGACVSPARDILLTGATGFLGGEIAAALHRSTEARLHCLVRAGQGATAAARLERTVERLGLDRSRVRLVDGTLPGSALADPDLARRIDTVVHGAAVVNLFAGYPKMREVNVLGSRAVLEFAARGVPKAVHHVSTTGIFLSPRYRSCTVFEDEQVEGQQGLLNGYAASKWVSDTMMLRARSRGFAVSVYRPAFVGWHAASGRHGDQDLIALLLRSSLEAGRAPDLDLQVNSTPVEVVAGAVAAVVSSSPARSGTFHLANPAAVRFVDVAALAGLPVVPLSEWQEAVTRTAPAFARFAALVRSALDDDRSGAEEMRYQHDRRYDDHRLREALGGSYRPPPIDAAYVSRLVRACVVPEVLPGAVVGNDRARRSQLHPS